MTNQEASRILHYYRKDLLKISQEEISSYFGLSLRTYRDIETNKVKCREMHLLAAESLLDRRSKGML